MDGKRSPGEDSSDGSSDLVFDSNRYRGPALSAETLSEEAKEGQTEMGA